jgi:hypothetical protein
VDVAPFVVPDTQTSKLIQPCERPLDDPPPPPETTAGRGAAHGQQGHDVTRAQPVPNRCGVIATIADYADRPAPGSAAFALQRRNRIDQREGFLASRSDWHRSSGSRAGRLVRHRSNAVCSRAWRGRSDSGQSACRHTPHARNNCPRWRVTNRCNRCARASSGARSASDPRCLPVANRARVANTSSPIRSPAPSATSATESHCAGQRGYR